MLAPPGRVEQQQQSTIAILGLVLQLCHVLSEINRDPISRKEIPKKKGKELEPWTYRAEVKGIEGLVGKEGILRVLERSLIETERWRRRSSETKIVHLVCTLIGAWMAIGTRGRIGTNTERWPRSERNGRGTD